MKCNCFYYGIFTAEGYCCLDSDSAFQSGQNLIVDGLPSSVKQELFESIKVCLCKNKIPFTDFRTPTGSCGLHCESFKITDSFYKSSHNKDAEIIPIEKIQIHNSDSLGNAKKLLNEQHKNLQRAERFLSACRTIRSDLIRLETPYINEAKINRFTSHIWQKITHGMQGRIGREYTRSVTCLTGDGVELNMEAFDIYCRKLLVISDNVGTVSGIIIDRLRGYALGSGYDVVCCPCALGGVEHLIIPELGFGVFTSKHFHHTDFRNERKIYSRRFLSPSADNIAIRRDFSLRAFEKMVTEIFVSLKKCEEIDCKLDELFYNSTDTKQLTKYTLAKLCL